MGFLTCAQPEEIPQYTRDPDEYMRETGRSAAVVFYMIQSLVCLDLPVLFETPLFAHLPICSQLVELLYELSFPLHYCQCFCCFSVFLSLCLQNQVM